MPASMRFIRVSHAVTAALLLAAGAASAAAPEGSQELDTVNVVGERQRERSEVGSRLNLSLQETPAAVAVIGKEELDLRGDQSAMLAVSRAPGFSPVGMSAFAGSALAARGFSGNNSVAQLYDGNRLFVSGGAMSFPTDTWPFQRIEVLAGPASVLYGSGAIGGAVNYVPRAINRERAEHEVYASLASWDTYRLAAASTGPISGRVAYRANVVVNDSAGYIDRNDSRTYAASGALLVGLGESSTLTLMLDRGDIDTTPYYGAPLIGGGIDPGTRRENYNVADARTRFLNTWARARLDVKLSDTLALRNELYYLDTTRYFRNLENYTWNPATQLVDRSFNFGTDIAQWQTGNRFDLTLSQPLAGHVNQLIAGLELNQVGYSVDSVTTTNTSVNRYDPVPGLFNYGAGFVPTLGTTTKQAALFAENVFDLTAKLKLVAGLRVERIDLERRDKVALTRADLDFKPVTWRLGTVFEVNAATSLYAQYVVGNDAAGSLISLPAANAAKLQTGRQWELGLKQSFWQGRADWTAALYGIEKDNLVSRDPLIPNVAQQIGQQSARGVEMSMAVRPMQVLTIDANLAVLRARFDDFNELVGGVAVSRSGNTPPNTPETSANLFANWQISDSWQIGGGARYVGKRWSDNANTLQIPSYTVADAFVNYRLNARTLFTLRGRNLTDEQWVVAPYNSGRQWALGDPRSWELSMRLAF
ncbi:MAG: TonB-dependent siderophore receptor [Steroidobacteraceae bacterium]